MHRPLKKLSRRLNDHQLKKRKEKMKRRRATNSSRRKKRKKHKGWELTLPSLFKKKEKKNEQEKEV